MTVQLDAMGRLDLSIGPKYHTTSFYRELLYLPTNRGYEQQLRITVL